MRKRANGNKVFYRLKIAIEAVSMDVGFQETVDATVRWSGAAIHRGWQMRIFTTIPGRMRGMFLVGVVLPCDYGIMMRGVKAPDPPTARGTSMTPRAIAVVAICLVGLMAVASGAEEDEFSGPDGGWRQLTLPEWCELARKARSAELKNEAVQAVCTRASDWRKEKDPEKMKAKRAQMVGIMHEFFETLNNEETRRHLLEAALVLKSPDLLGDVVGCLKTKNGTLALDVLGNSGDPRAPVSILAVVQDATFPISQRERATAHLERIGTQETVEALNKIYQEEKSPELKEALGEALDILEIRLKRKNKP